MFLAGSGRGTETDVTKLAMLTRPNLGNAGEVAKPSWDHLIYLEERHVFSSRKLVTCQSQPRHQARGFLSEDKDTPSSHKPPK